MTNKVSINISRRYSRYYEGLRLAEQTIPVEDAITYVNRFEGLKMESNASPCPVDLLEYLAANPTSQPVDVEFAIS